MGDCTESNLEDVEDDSALHRDDLVDTIAHDLRLVGSVADTAKRALHPPEVVEFRLNLNSISSRTKHWEKAPFHPTPFYLEVLSSFDQIGQVEVLDVVASQQVRIHCAHEVEPFLKVG